MIFGAWFFFSVAAGMFAHIRRNRSGSGWFLVGLLFSPLVAFVLLAILNEGAWVDPAIKQARVQRQAGVAIVVILAVVAIFATATGLGLLATGRTTTVTDQAFDQKMQTELARRNASHQ